MDDLIHIELTQPKYAPWGLLTESEPQRIIIWLTEAKPVGTVRKASLSPGNIEAILSSEREKVIRQRGLSQPTPSVDPSAFGISPEMAQRILNVADLIREKNSNIPNQDEVKAVIEAMAPKVEAPVADEKLAMAGMGATSVAAADVEDEQIPLVNLSPEGREDIYLEQEKISEAIQKGLDEEVASVVSEALQKEEVKAVKEAAPELPETAKERIKRLKDLYENNPFIIQLLEQHGAKVKKDLRILAKGRVPQELFARILKAEERGSKRKSVMAFIRGVMQEKINKNIELRGAASEGGLENAYFNMIDDEEEPEIITKVPEPK